MENRRYTEQHGYDVNLKMPNPATPITDVTTEIKRPLLQQKPEEEWVKYEVPKIVDENQWERANDQVKRRGRGRGKQGKAIQALLRNRMFCPRCRNPMVVRRDGKFHQIDVHRLRTLVLNRYTLDAVDLSLQRLSDDAHGCGSLQQAGVGVVAQASKERNDAITTVKGL